MIDVDNMREKALEAKMLFEANSLGEITINTGKTIKSKDKGDKPYLLRLTTPDKYNFQVYDGNYSALYYGTLEYALRKMYRLANKKELSNEFISFAQQYRDTKPSMANKDIKIQKILEAIDNL